MKRPKRIIARMIFAIVGVGLLLGLWVISNTNPNPWSKSELERLVSGLNEAAAIGVPHGFLMDAQAKADHALLVAKVEMGKELDPAESTTYRRLFQSVLLTSQQFLARFDGELTVLDNFGAERANNCLTSGISGRHDHHDVSARRNFAGVLASLTKLKAASTSLGRIRHANAAYKDLVDIISHLGVAPHTVSVGYLPPDLPWPDGEPGKTFEAMLVAYKDAQFSPVNSLTYWQAVDRAKAAYVALILLVQDQIMAQTSPLERRIAGRFLSPQTLAPPVDLDRSVRPR